MRVATIDSQQPWVEVRFGVRFSELATAEAAAMRHLADAELRATARREGSSNWFLDNGCHVAHRISRIESILAVSCVADGCIVDPLGRLASIHHLLCAAARSSACLDAALVNWLLVAGPAGLMADCVTHILGCPR